MKFSPIGKNGLLIKTKNASFALDHWEEKLNADVAIFSSKMGDFPVDTKNTVLIDGAGEYEVKDSFIKGVDTVDGDVFTSYRIQIEGINVFLLGVKDKKQLSEIQNSFSDVDVVVVPSDLALDPKIIHSFSVAKLASFVVPIGYKKDGPEINSLIKAVSDVEKVSKEKVVKTKDVLVDGIKLILFE